MQAGRLTDCLPACQLLPQAPDAVSPPHHRHESFQDDAWPTSTGAEDDAAGEETDIAPELAEDEVHVRSRGNEDDETASRRRLEGEKGGGGGGRGGNIDTGMDADDLAMDLIRQARQMPFTGDTQRREMGGCGALVVFSSGVE